MVAPRQTLAGVRPVEPQALPSRRTCLSSLVDAGKHTSFTSKKAQLLTQRCSAFSSSSTVCQERIIEVTVNPGSNSADTNGIHAHSNPWSGVSTEELLQETRRLQQHLQTKRNDSNNSMKIISMDDYFNVLEAWMEHAKSNPNQNNIQAAQHAHSLLESMQQAEQQQHHASIFEPRLSFYEVVLQAYATCHGGQEAALQAQSILDFLWTQQKHGQCLRPTTKTWNIVLNAWAKSKTKDSGRRAQELYDIMLQSQHCYPNAMTVVTLMNAWNKSGHYEAANQVMHIFQTILKEWQTDQNERRSEAEATPDAATAATIPANSSKDSTTTTTKKLIPVDIAMFHAIMDTIVKAGKQGGKRKRRHNKSHKNNHDSLQTQDLRDMTAVQAANQVEGILESILENATIWRIQPNTRTFAIVLDAWAQAEFHSSVQRHHRDQGKAAQRAQAILDLLLGAHYGGNSGSLNPSRSMLSTITPNEVMFTTVITAWAHAKQAQKAHDNFHRLLDLFRASTGSEQENLVPTIVTGNALMTAWAREKRTDFILQILQTMAELTKETGRKECQPDLRSFNILLGSYGKSGNVQEAVSLLKWMEEFSQRNGDDEAAAWSSYTSLVVHPELLEAPDVVSYNSVLLALGQRGDSQQAEALVVHMKERGLEPTQITYTSLMNAFARSHDPTKVAKATSYLKELSSKRKPDNICLVAFLQVCARVDRGESQNAFDKALQAFDMIDPGQINHVAFSTMLQAINRLLVWDRSLDEDSCNNEGIWESETTLVQERSKQIKDLCVKCCEMGCLSDSVYRELRRAGINLQNVLRSEGFEPVWSEHVPASQRPYATQQQQPRGRIG